MKAAGIVVAVIVAVGLFGVGKAVNHDQNTSNNVAVEWSSVTIGMDEFEVRLLLGKPDDVTTSTTSNYEGGIDRYDTWDYGTLASTTYSLDFINGKLDTKSKL